MRCNTDTARKQMATMQMVHSPIVRMRMVRMQMVRMQMVPTAIMRMCIINSGRRRQENYVTQTTNDIIQEKQSCKRR